MGKDCLQSFQLIKEKKMFTGERLRLGEGKDSHFRVARSGEEAISKIKSRKEMKKRAVYKDSTKAWAKAQIVKGLARTW